MEPGDSTPDASQIASSETDSPRDLDERWTGTRSFVNRIYVDEPRGAVLGSNVMMDHDVYFDIAKRRLGVARATCAF